MSTFISDSKQILVNFCCIQISYGRPLSTLSNYLAIISNSKQIPTSFGCIQISYGRPLSTLSNHPTIISNSKQILGCFCCILISYGKPLSTLSNHPASQWRRKEFIVAIYPIYNSLGLSICMKIHDLHIVSDREKIQKCQHLCFRVRARTTITIYMILFYVI